MPRTRLYASGADRQAAYRERCLTDESQTCDVSPQSLKPGTGNPWPRWRRLAGKAEQSLGALHAEMKCYHDARSERWQEGEKAEEFDQRLEALAEVQELIQEWIASS